MRRNTQTKKELTYFSREHWVHKALLFLLLLIFVKLIFLQVVQASDLKAKGVESRTADVRLTPQRGTIFDAQGHVLAQSLPVKGIYADPRTLTNLINNKQFKKSKDEIARDIASILGFNQQEILDKLNKDLSWVILAHQVEINKANQVMGLKIPGIGLIDEDKRVYPMGSLAASTLGIVNASGHGVEGIELYYDQDLYGKPGFESEEQDTSARSIINTLHQSDPPQPGYNLTLTLDSTIQYLVEQQLDDVMKATNAKAATILAMDPMTGKILGIGSRPSFDPNNYDKTPPEQRKNLAISMSYEPGSTFKTITGAAALEERVITPDETFEDPGYYRVGPRYITNWDSDLKPHGKVTFTQGMELSSNVVLAQVGMKLGTNLFYTYLKAFGFGTKTGVDIAGEESGLLVPQDKAREIDMATMSFGQANLVTPVQLLSAICAVANGGTLYRPYIVDKITTIDGVLIKQNKPQAVRQVISKSTSAQMTRILEEVVANGTGRTAQIPGIKVAGKTGTAQKVDPKTGGYSTTDYIASFAAFAPADNPKIAVLVVIDSPKGESHQGGTLAGPRAKAIIEGALQYYGIPVANDTPSTVTVSPDDKAVRPGPKPVTPERTPLSDEAVVPDLTGMTMRQAGETLSKLELHFNFSGSGLAYNQSPAPGKVVRKGEIIDVKFSSSTQ